MVENIFFRLFKKKKKVLFKAYNDWVIVELLPEKTEKIGKLFLASNSMDSVKKGVIISINDDYFTTGDIVVFFERNIVATLTPTIVVIHKSNILALQNKQVMVEHHDYSR